MIHRPGFTLLELLMATILSVLLMLAITGFIAQIGKSAWTARDEQTLTTIDDPTVQQIASLLNADLANASRIDTSVANEFVLFGHCALDTPSRARSHRAVEVQYALRSIQGRTWLVRRQRFLDVLTSDNTQVDLVATGIASFSVSPSSAGPPNAKASSPQPLYLHLQLQNRPDQTINQLLNFFTPQSS